MANVQSFESEVKIIPGLLAGEDLSSYQYCAVKISSGSIVHCATLGEFTIGILQNAPSASGKTASVAYGGISQVKLGGTVSQNNRLVANVTTGKLVAQTDPDEAVIAIALSDGSDGDLIPAIVALGTALNSAVADRALANTKIWIGDASGEAQAFALSGDATMTAGGVVTVSDVTVGSDAAGDMLYRGASAYTRLAKGTAAQILAMNSGATAPEWISQSALAVANVATTSSGDAAGDLIYRDAATTLERLAKGTAAQILAMNGAATAPEWIAQSAMTVGNATLAASATNVVTTSAGDAAGDLIYRDAAATLERLAKGTAGQILQMNAGATAPQWASVSADVTIADGGAVTIANDVVTAAKMGSTAGAGSGIIFKGTNTANAISELNVPVGNIIVGTTNDVTVLDMGATAGNIMVDNGTAPASVAVSGDATLAAAGTLTLAKNFIRTAVVDIGAAAVKTLNATPVVLVDFSALQGAGTIAAGDSLIFHGAVVQLYGGAASYDQNENMTIVYQTAGGGATVSTTLANFCNGGAAGKQSTIKAIVTDVAPDADEDLVVKCSASPFAAAGDRNMRVTTYYSVFTPHV